MTRSPEPKDPRIAELVGIARELALVAGYEAAEKLMAHFGGQRINVPVKMRPSLPLVKAIGIEAARQLAAIVEARPMTETTIEVPLGGRIRAARRRAAIRDFDGSKNQAAAQFGCSRRTVQRYRNADDAGTPLFDGLSKKA